MENQKSNLIWLIQKKDPDIKHIEIIHDYEGIKYWNEVSKIRTADILQGEELDSLAK